MTMLENIIARWPRFGNYLSLYLPLLSKTGQLHFIRLLIGFISYDGAKNLTGLNHATYDQRHLSSVCRFIGESAWDEEEFEQLRYVDLNRRVRRYIESERAHGREPRLYLCIDDTNNPKRGEKAAGVSYQYSHLAGGLILCQCLVTAIIVIGDFAIPIEYKLYRRQSECEDKKQAGEFISKTDLAKMLVEKFQPPTEDVIVYVVVDSWYTNEKLITTCQQRKFIFVGGLMSNRAIMLNGEQTYQKVSEYAAKLSAKDYHSVTVGNQRWRVRGERVHLKGGLVGKVVFSHAPGFTAGNQTRYFFSTLSEVNPQWILSAYATRWGIECFHKAIKQLLGLSDNQCMSTKSIRRLMVLAMIAYSYLLIEQVENKDAYYIRKGETLPTMAQVQREHKLQFHQAMIAWAYQQAQNGIPLDNLLQKIAA